LFAAGAAWLTGFIVTSVSTPSSVEAFKKAGECEFAHGKITSVLPAKRQVEYQYLLGRARKVVTEDFDRIDHEAAANALLESGGGSPISDLLQGSAFGETSARTPRDIEVWVSPSNPDVHKPVFQRGNSGPPPGVLDAEKVKGRVLSAPPAVPHLVYEFEARGKVVRTERPWWNAPPAIGTSFGVAYRRSSPDDHVTTLDQRRLGPTDAARIGGPLLAALAVLVGLLWPVERASRRSRRLLASGLETNAEVLEVARRGWVDLLVLLISLFTAGSARGASSSRVTYEFSTKGRFARGRRTIPSAVAAGLQPGQPIRVLFDPEDPSRSDLRGAVERFARVVS
jgi:hypothetical protein